MQNGLYVALSAQIALEKRLNTIADNVANASTVGFRSTGVRFRDVMEGLSDDSLSFASSGSTYLSTLNGSLSQTGNPYDFAIKGDSWFGIQTPAGTVLTRDGRFTLTPNGQLTTLEGHPVLDAGGQPIQIDAAGGPPVAGADGSLRQNGQQVAALGLFDYAPGENVSRFGNSGVVPDKPPQPIVDRSDAGVEQGFVEESNVNPIQEMTRLIMVQRQFENAFALVRQTDASYTDAIKTLGSK